MVRAHLSHPQFTQLQTGRRMLARPTSIPQDSSRVNSSFFAPLPLAHPATAETIKVPQMAESITEGTLKSWSKQVGDAVAADEEVATIETDKVCPSSSPLLLTNFSQIDISVNAPQAGTIVKLLADEEATVTVGQDLFIIEFGEGAQAPASSQSAPSEETPPANPQPPSPPPSDVGPKTTQKEQKTSSEDNSKREKKAEDKQKTYPVQEHRGETRVCIPSSLVRSTKTACIPGQNEPNAAPHCRASQRIPEFCRLTHDFQRD